MNKIKTILDVHKKIPKLSWYWYQYIIKSFVSNSILQKFTQSFMILLLLFQVHKQTWTYVITMYNFLTQFHLKHFTFKKRVYAVLHLAYNTIRLPYIYLVHSI